MTNTTKFSCQIGTTNSELPLGLEIWVDDLQIFNEDQLDGIQDFEYNIEETDAEHELRFIIKNKTTDYTKVDDQGNIISDSRVIVRKLNFDGIDLNYNVLSRMVYTHDFNSTQPATQQPYSEELGCNGVLSLKFYTPIYIWLLENI